nr:hypothetical protein [Tanacetum cinerariifolium]
AAGSTTPLTTITIFNDEEMTLVDTLIKLKDDKAKGVAFKDSDDIDRLFTPGQLNKKSFKDIQSLYMKEQELIADFVPIGSEEDERRIRDVSKKAEEESSDKCMDNTKKRKAGSRMKRMSKRQKTDVDLEEEEKLKTFLKIVLDEEGIIDYEVLDKRFPIINWESKLYHYDRHGTEGIYYKIFKSDGSSRWIKTFSEMVKRQSMEDTLSKFMSESAKRHKENSNLIKEIRASTDAAIRNQEVSVKTLEIQIGQMSKELAIMKYPKGIVNNVLVGIGKFVFFVDFIILDMPEDIKVPLILERSFLSTAHAKIDVFKRKITLRVGEEKIIFKPVKPTISLIKRVYMLSLREIMELDLEARLMGETLVLNRSLYPFFEDYIELNNLNVLLELRRDQVDDLMPTIKECEKIHIDCAYNLKLSCMIVLEDMDAYRDEEMGDVIFGKPFLREIGINAKRFEGIITIHNGNEEVTYQMVRSHLRFKHHTNEQCNKIPPLLKVSEEDKMNGISHSYQKLKGFYKGVLNLWPEYVRDAKMENGSHTGT